MEAGRDMVIAPAARRAMLGRAYFASVACNSAVFLDST